MADSDLTVDFLPSKYRDVPLFALRNSYRNKLSQYMNLVRRLPHETTGLTPDYNGLAELVGFEWLDQENLSRAENPTAELLKEWSLRNDLKPTVGNLVDYLLKLGREDVITDCRNILLRDIEAYLQRRNDNPIQDSTVTGSNEVGFGTFTSEQDVDEMQCITVGDVFTGERQYYDAFVSVCSPDSQDYQFVTNVLVPKLESAEVGLKLCVPWRDDLPGASKYATNAHLISDRCRRIILILSPEFLKSQICEFQLKFSHSLSPCSRKKKIIPLIIEPCEVPPLLYQVSTCDYTKESVTPWFWPRLEASIKAPINIIPPTDTSLQNITLNISPVSSSYISRSDSTKSNNHNSSTSGQNNNRTGKQ